MGKAIAIVYAIGITILVATQWPHWTGKADRAVLNFEQAKCYKEFDPRIERPMDQTVVEFCNLPKPN